MRIRNSRAPQSRTTLGTAQHRADEFRTPLSRNRNQQSRALPVRHCGPPRQNAEISHAISPVRPHHATRSRLVVQESAPQRSASTAVFNRSTDPPTPVPRDAPVEEIKEDPALLQPSQNNSGLERPFRAVVECPVPIATTILSGRFDQTLQRLLGLSAIHYDGCSFIIEGPDLVSLAAAEMQLKAWITISRLRGQQRREGPEDLRRVQFSDDLEFKGEQACSICLAEVHPGDWVRRTPCLHIFHPECLEQWLQTRKVCPVDRHYLRN